MTRPGAAGAAGEVDRAEAMGRRLARTAERLGIPADGRQLMLQAFRTAMEPRRARVAHDHHPDYLHPARTALILMDDARMADPERLATALLLETRDPSLAASPAAVERVSAVVAAELALVPVAGQGGERLLERLLTLTPGAAMVAAAERLDHARHLHLRPSDEWKGYHGTTCSAYAPVAVRAHEVLGSRLEWWCETFSRRFLER